MPLFQTTPMTLVIGVTLDWPNMPFWPFSFDLLHVHTGWNRRFRKKSSIPAQNRGVLGTFGTLFFFSASEVYTSSRNIVRFGAKENNASREVVETYWNGSTWNRRFWARIEYFSKKSPIPGQNRGGLIRSICCDAIDLKWIESKLIDFRHIVSVSVLLVRTRRPPYANDIEKFSPLATEIIF